MPGVSTAATSAITCCGATSGGEVLSENGAAVTSRGVCWNTGGDPTISDDHTVDGSGMGIFISQIAGLTGNTIYAVRAYATNSVGTVYGTERSFTTLAPLLPLLTTTAASDITIHSASSGGNITNDGGSAVTSRGVCWNTTGNPSTAGQHTSDGTGSGAYTSELTGLGNNTTYHIRAFATNGAGTAYGNELTFTTLVPDGQPCPGTPIVWYGEKNYFTVQIGTQCWFRDNLNIGTRIDSSLSQTNNGVVEKYCYSDLEANCNVYGGLYQWAELVQYLNGASNTTTWDPVPAGNIQGLCPTGWHIPSDVEWATLTDYLGGTGAGGGKMKETGTAHWLSPNTGATNESGFTALPAGFYDSDGVYLDIFNLTHFWSSTQYNAANSWIRSLGYDQGTIDSNGLYKAQAISVRCMKN
jgi:uncharacterized protein (TIGR02145 family)